MADVLALAAKAQDINFVQKFESDLHNLLAVLGKSEVQVVAPGTAFKIYTTSGTLSTATVAEKAEIPDSGIATGDATVVSLDYKKYRNLTGIESIGSKGFDVAVGATNEALLKLVQKAVRATIYDGLETGTGTATTSTNTFQAIVAAAAGEVAEIFEDEAYTPVFFANPADAYAYLGTASISIQQASGLAYLANFMGIGNVILDSNVTAGTVIGTAVENIEVVAANVAAIPGMDLTMDASGIIGVHTGALYENGAIQTVAYCGLAVEPVFLDRIVLASYSA